MYFLILPIFKAYIDIFLWFPIRPIYWHCHMIPAQYHNLWLYIFNVGTLFLSYTMLIRLPLYIWLAPLDTVHNRNRIGLLLWQVIKRYNSAAHTVHNDSEYRLFGTSTLLPWITHFYHSFTVQRASSNQALYGHDVLIITLSNILSLYIALLWSTLWHVS